MKKTLNYLLLLVMGMLALNLQSCDDDDDNKSDDQTNSILGSWLMTSYAGYGDVTFNDSSYQQIDKDYIYTARCDSGTWMVARSSYKQIDNKIYILPDTTNAITATVNGSKMTLTDGLYTETFEKKALPETVKTMIANGEYGKFSDTDGLMSY